MSTLGERIKSIRNENKYLQADFAKELGISRSHLSGIEQDNVKPSLTLIKFMCLKFNFDETWVLTGSDDQKATAEMSEDIFKKYKDPSVFLEKMSEKYDGEHLEYIIDSYTYLFSILSSTLDIKDCSEAEDMIKIITLLFDGIDNMITNCKIYGVTTNTLTYISNINACLIKLIKQYEK